MRVIDADEAIINFGFGWDDIPPTREEFVYFLKKQPTIDAVPVVRCRECIQGEADDPDFPDQYYCHAGCGWNKGDFYCAYGERKEGADNG